MNILKKVFGLACIGLLSYGLSSCNNEDDATINAVAGLEVNADLLKLTDNGTNIAGELSIASSSKDIQLIWNTDSICNLDTTLTSISPQNGRYVLPIKWQKHLTDSTFAPKNKTKDYDQISLLSVIDGGSAVRQLPECRTTVH